MASLLFAAETSAEFARVKRDIFQNPLLIGLISEFTQKSFVLDATCKAIREARFGVVGFSLKEQCSRKYLRGVVFNRMINRRMIPSKQLTLNLEFSRITTEKDKYMEDFGINMIDDELNSETAPLIAEARDVRLKLIGDSVSDFMKLKGVQWDNVTRLSLAAIPSKVVSRSLVKFMKNLVSLEMELDVKFDVGILRGLERLKNLSLDAEAKYLIKSPGPLGLKSLETLTIDALPVNTATFFGPVPSLTTLTVEKASQAGLQVLSANFPTLKTLAIANLEGVQDMSGLSTLASLESLQIPVEGVSLLPDELRIAELGILWSESSQKSFDANEGVRTIGNKLACLKQCVSLSLIAFPESALSVLKEVKDLKKLKLEGTFDSLDFLASAPGLESLDIREFNGSEITPIAQCKMLKRLVLDKCYKEKSHVQNLEILHKALPDLIIHFFDDGYEGEDEDSDYDNDD